MLLKINAEMTPHAFFYIALLFMLIHEMDAIRCKEWRIFPLLSRLDNKQGFRIFIVAHIPVYFFLLWKLTLHPNELFINSMNVFFISHLVLHLFYMKHPKNEFKDWISWIFIFGAAVFGLIDILIK